MRWRLLVTYVTVSSTVRLRSAAPEPRCPNSAAAERSCDSSAPTFPDQARRSHATYVFHPRAVSEPCTAWAASCRYARRCTKSKTAMNPKGNRCISYTDQLYAWPSQTQALRLSWSSPRRCTSAATCQPKISLLAIVATTVRTRVRPHFRGRERGDRFFLFSFRCFWRADACVSPCCSSFRPEDGRLRRLISEARRAAVVGSRNLAGGSGCGSTPAALVCSVRQHATFDSRQLAALTPRPWSSARVCKRPPSSITAAAAPRGAS